MPQEDDQSDEPVEHGNPTLSKVTSTKLNSPQLAKPRQPRCDVEGAAGGVGNSTDVPSSRGMVDGLNPTYNGLPTTSKEEILQPKANDYDCIQPQNNVELDTGNHRPAHSSPHRALQGADIKDGSQASPIHADVTSETSIHVPVLAGTVSGWSHQQVAPQTDDDGAKEDDWQDMPAYAPYDMYDDNGKLIAREMVDLDDEANPYANLGGAAKGYTRLQVDEDAQSATSMDDHTAYLFKEPDNDADAADDVQRDPLAQMQATKTLLTEPQRIAYIGVVRLAMVDMEKELQRLGRTRGIKKEADHAMEATRMWSQKMMVRLYAHMELNQQEQIMIEQLAEHGLQPDDLTPALMQNARVKNPIMENSVKNTSTVSLISSPDVSADQNCEEKSADSLVEDSRLPPYRNHDQEDTIAEDSHTGNMLQNVEASGSQKSNFQSVDRFDNDSPQPPPYEEHVAGDMPEVRTPSQLEKSRNIDIDLRWTVLCDLFLTLISDSVYDARSRTLLERVGSFLNVTWLDICRFEKRVSDALEMQEAAQKENWDEAAHMKDRQKAAKRRRLIMIGLATVGGGLVIGLSAGLLAPVIGAGLAAGFTTIGVTGSSGFLAGAGGAAIIGTGGVLTGGTVGARAANRRTGAVKTFEYRPLHNNKRVNLIVTVAGWMNGRIDDVRLPFSTVDPIMGDIYSVLWEPEMLRSMGDTIRILATEALTQGLQQILGSTILIALMASLQLPIVLSKLSYLIDNPWSVSMARADLAGLILADSLIDRNLGARPITLVGFSLGSRVIFACLLELTRRGAFGLVQNVYMFGTPRVVKRDEYLRIKTVVSGRLVNGYATNDWILGYLFRATSGGISRVAGLAAVDVPGIENIDVSAWVPGHMSYRTAMPRILREVGWAVESDQFTEIEDPDPDNHEKRQRELINEIEQARQELKKAPEKKRFGIFKTKKLAEKKTWETYDERMREEAEPSRAAHSDVDPQVLFDFEAIRKEVVELAAQGITVRALDSSLPPLKVNSVASASMNGGSNVNDMNGQRPVLRETKSAEGGSALKPDSGTKSSSKSFDYNEYEDRDLVAPVDEENISMTFDTAYREPPRIPSPRLTSATSAQSVFTTTPQTTSMAHKTNTPILASVPRSDSALNVNSPFAPDHNVWAEEEEEFSHESELKMTFE